ncbi:hypothetical protein L9F63_000976, partial [Diploptera punctata]
LVNDNIQSSQSWSCDEGCLRYAEHQCMKTKSLVTAKRLLRLQISFRMAEAILGPWQCVRRSTRINQNWSKFFYTS